MRPTATFLLCSLLLTSCLHEEPESLDYAARTGASFNPFAHPPLAIPDTDALREAVLSAAGAASLTPGVPGPSAELAVVPPDRLWTWYSWSMEGIDLPAEPAPVEAFDTPWRRLPWAEITEEGTLVVRWETREATPPGLAYVGIRVEEDALAAPRYRKWALEEGDEPRTEHEASYPLPKLLQPSYDVNDIDARGWGEVAWRVENYHPQQNSTRLWDGRTAFARGEAGTWQQLPTVVLGPQIDQLTESSVIISFETDVPTVAAVGVDDEPPVLSSGVPTHAEPTPSTRHEIPITGLAAGRTHVYQVAVSDGAHSSVTVYNTFQTRRPTDPVRVAILSDSRGGVGPGTESYEGVNVDVVGELFVDAARRDAEAIFFPGDLIDGYVTMPDVFDTQLRAWLHAVEGVHHSVPVYTTTGNHEVLVDAWSDGQHLDKDGPESAEAHFARLMVNPTGAPPPESEGAPPYDETVYSWDIGPVHFVLLNTNYWWVREPGGAHTEGRGNREGYLMQGQLDWLEADLAAAREAGAEHIVVMGHEPAFPVGGHVMDAMWWDGEIEAVNDMRERFWRTLAHHGVLAYVSGDDHNYSRALIGAETVEGAERSVWSIISGGCGAPYYAQDTPAAYAEQVEMFSAQQHYTLWTFDSDRVRLQVIGRTGQIIEDLELTTAREQP